MSGKTIGSDDNFLPVPGVPLWNETMAILICDPVSGISSNFYMGTWWAKPTTIRQMIHIQVPGDRGLFCRYFDPAPCRHPPSVAGLTLETLADGRLRYRYDGPMELRRTSEVSRNGMGSGPTVRAEFEFVFSSRYPIWDMHAEGAHREDTDVMFPGGHMEQLGFMNGTLRFEGESFTVRDGPTIRDHSRGARDFRKHHSHIWINAQFPGGWGFYSFAANMRGQQGEAVNGAAIVREGRIIPARLETDGLPTPGSNIWAPFNVILHPDGMQPIRMRAARLWNCFQIGMFEPADVFWGVPSTPDRRAMWALEQCCAFETGGETGIGNVERCNRDIVVDDHWHRMCTPENITSMRPSPQSIALHE